MSFRMCSIAHYMFIYVIIVIFFTKNFGCKGTNMYLISNTQILMR